MHLRLQVLSKIVTVCSLQEIEEDFLLGVEKGNSRILRAGLVSGIFGVSLQLLLFCLKAAEVLQCNSLDISGSTLTSKAAASSPKYISNSLWMLTSTGVTNVLYSWNYDTAVCIKCLSDSRAHRKFELLQCFISS